MSHPIRWREHKTYLAWTHSPVPSLFPPPYAPLDFLSSLYATMLTLEPGSLCDVCADEFSPRNLPHCIPCGPFSFLLFVFLCFGKFSLLPD